MSVSNPCSIAKHFPCTQTVLWDIGGIYRVQSLYCIYTIRLHAQYATYLYIRHSIPLAINCCVVAGRLDRGFALTAVLNWLLAGHLQGLCYEDSPQLIGYGVTISGQSRALTICQCYAPSPPSQPAQSH